jgi:hypothetical protein
MILIGEVLSAMGRNGRWSVTIGCGAIVVFLASDRIDLRRAFTVGEKIKLYVERHQTPKSPSDQQEAGAEWPCVSEECGISFAPEALDRRGAGSGRAGVETGPSTISESKNPTQKRLAMLGRDAAGVSAGNPVKRAGARGEAAYHHG